MKAFTPQGNHPCHPCHSAGVAAEHSRADCLPQGIMGDHSLVMKEVVAISSFEIHVGGALSFFEVGGKTSITPHCSLENTAHLPVKG